MTSRCVCTIDTRDMKVIDLEAGCDKHTVADLKYPPLTLQSLSDRLDNLEKRLIAVEGPARQIQLELDEILGQVQHGK